jgi:hypothetical protein
MAGAAAFSMRAWMPSAAFDPIEDGLHSFAATAMGFSFALGVLVRVLQRDRREKGGRWFDATAIVASIVIPPLMAPFNQVAGLVQRLMFLIAYAWYGKQALLVVKLARKACYLPER